jgi:prefoldin subunit 5
MTVGLTQQEIFDFGMDMVTSPTTAFRSNTQNPKKTGVVPFEITPVGMNNSFQEDTLLDNSNISLGGHGSQEIYMHELFDRFMLKFNIVCLDIEGIYSRNPQSIPSQLMERLSVLRKETGNLNRLAKKADNLTSYKLKEYERQIESLTTDICKLRMEVDGLVNMNNRLTVELDEKSQRIGMLLDKSGVEGIGGKFNMPLREEDLIDLASRAEIYRAELHTLQQKHEAAQLDNGNIRGNNELLRNQLEDQIQRYQELLKDNMDMQANIDKVKQMVGEEDKLKEELTILKSKEVPCHSYRRDHCSCR